MPGAGQLNTLVTIRKKEDKKNEKTGEVSTVFNPYHRKIPAMKQDASGGSTRRGLQVEESVKSVFTIPYIKDISTEWQVEVLDGSGDGPVFEIVSVVEPSDRRQWMELHCSDVK